jgi:hypothetical protein
MKRAMSGILIHEDDYYGEFNLPHMRGIVR